MSTTHTIHANTLTAGLAADCPRCREIIANAEATSPGFDDLAGTPGSPERAAAAQRAMLGNTAALAEVANHLPDTVTRIKQNTSGGYDIRIGYTISLQDISDIIDTASTVAGYWAATIRREPDGATIITEHDGDYGPNGHGAHIVTMRQIAEAITSILDLDEPTGSSIIRNLHDYIRGIDTIDPDTADAVLQIATFGQVTYN